RATVAGIDLGTTNSVICLFHSLTITIIVTFEEKETIPSLLPHPVDVVVGQAAKDRINTHPHHTVYHAKRIIGREFDHASVESVPYHLPPSETVPEKLSSAVLFPSEVGAYIINHLKTITRNYLQHDNIQSAVIAIPAKFEPSQRDATIRAFQAAGLKVARVLEEPTAAALAYGLHKREDVHYVMVYDFGGGTLDISLLYVGEGGFIDVLGSDGDEQLGGADFDAAVAHWLLDKHDGDTIVNRVTASMTKIEKDFLEGSTRHDAMDVEDLVEELCPKLKETPLCTVDHLYKRSILPIGRLLKDLNLQKDEIDEVVMVGGTTRMPQIRELVRVELEKERLNTHIDPDLTVAYGAA
ncbi:HSP70 domain-containing protein, partial [Thalassiosira pseudonana CCMP1335]